MITTLRSLISVIFFFFKQKTAYEMRISDWSSDVCSSDLSPFVTSGIRLGTAAITTRGTKEDQMLEIAEMVDVALLKHDDDAALDKIHNKVKALMAEYP